MIWTENGWSTHLTVLSGGLFPRETPKPTCAIWFWHVFTSEAKKKGQRWSTQPECAGCYDPFPDIIFAYVCIAKLRHSAKIAVWYSGKKLHEIEVSNCSSHFTHQVKRWSQDRPQDDKLKMETTRKLETHCGWVFEYAISKVSRLRALRETGKSGEDCSPLGLFAIYFRCSHYISHCSLSIDWLQPHLWWKREKNPQLWWINQQSPLNKPRKTNIAMECHHVYERQILKLNGPSIP